jgi:2-polyprenyl-3-methyl-5-hydroxy-6-metoxy-1,4-benzoquinol methylase
MEYAESNFLHDNAKHLHVDKSYIRENFNLNGKLVLDFGCGMGGMSLWYARNWSCRVHGADIDGFHIDVANALKAKYQQENVTFLKRDILDQPLTGRYDYIFMNDVAEHIPYPALQAILKQLTSCLAPGGRIFISYPPWEGPYASHVTRVTRLPWSQYLPDSILMQWIERKNMQLTGEHESDLVSAYKGLNHLTHWRLTQLTERAGLHMERRLSHSLLRKIPGFKRSSPNYFPFKFLISKEIVVFKSTAC